MSAAQDFRPDPSWPSMEELARQKWGEPNEKESKRPRDLRFGKKASKSVNLEKLVWQDFEPPGAKGGYIDLHKSVRGELPPRPNGATNGNGKAAPWDDIAVTYPYHDTDGRLILEVVRTISGSPRFRQRQPMGNGKWKWSVADIKGYDRLLYRLPGLLASGAETVWICEGEKDADTLSGEGLIATTNIGGAGKWRGENAERFRDKSCIILQDNDDAGRLHASRVAQSLVGIAASVKIIELPDLPPKGDVTDWFDIGGTIDELWRIAENAPEYRPKGKDGTLDPTRVCSLLSASTLLSLNIPPPEELLGSLITKSTRAFLVGPTGLGKTMMGYSIGAGMSAGLGFLHWRSARPCRVLVIDGEMPGDLVQQRLADALRRANLGEAPEGLFFYSLDLCELLARQYPQLGEFAPLCTERGQRFVMALADALKPDVVIFDNLMSLLGTAALEPEKWEDTLPLVAALSANRIGQLWLDHTNKSGLQFGTGTKSWRFDTVGVMLPLPAEDRRGDDLAFTLSFADPGKARRRTAENRADYQRVIIRLREDRWSSEPEAGGDQAPAPSAKPKKPEGPKSGSQKTMLNIVQTSIRDAGNQLEPRPGEPWVRGITRFELRDRLIVDGWFPEDLLLVGEAGSSKLKRSGYSMENNALTALETQGFLRFNRNIVWLP